MKSAIAVAKKAVATTAAATPRLVSTRTTLSATTPTRIVAVTASSPLQAQSAVRAPAIVTRKKSALATLQSAQPTHSLQTAMTVAQASSVLQASAHLVTSSASP